MTAGTYSAGHGTELGSIITGSGNFAGFAPGAVVDDRNVNNISTATVGNYLHNDVGDGDAVINGSWDFTTYQLSQADLSGLAVWQNALQYAVQSGRNGLGAVVVMAAGNERAALTSIGPATQKTPFNGNADTALRSFSSDPRIITVGGTYTDGSTALDQSAISNFRFSNPGSGVLVSALRSNVSMTQPSVLQPDGTYSSTSTVTESATSVAAPQVSAIADLVVANNPILTWADVQEILVDLCYAPSTAAANSPLPTPIGVGDYQSGFVMNQSTDLNGGGRHFSRDEGYGVVDANVAVHLAAAWTDTWRNTYYTRAQEWGEGDPNQYSSPQNIYSIYNPPSASGFSVGLGGTTQGVLNVGTGVERVTHVQVTINDSYLPIAFSRVVLISPQGTRSVIYDQPGFINGVDKTVASNPNGVDANRLTTLSNAFWGENGSGQWKLEVANYSGNTETIKNWSLSFAEGSLSDTGKLLVFMPEVSYLSSHSPDNPTVVTNTGRTNLSPAANGAHEIDLIALPQASRITMTGGAGMIDGVSINLLDPVSVINADGSTGSLTVANAVGQVHAGDGPTNITWVVPVTRRL